MEVIEEEVRLINGDMYEYFGTTMHDGQSIDFVCHYGTDMLRRKGAPTLMPYAEMVIQLGRNKFRELLREY